MMRINNLRRRCLILRALACSAILATAPAAYGAARVIGLDEALQIAAAQSPERTAAQRRAEAGRASAHGAISRMLPRLSVSEEYQRYESPFLVSFGGLSFKARERGTNTVTVAASQPLLGLIRLNADRAATARQADAAHFDSEASAHTVAARIKTLYLQLFEARALADTAIASETTLNEQVAVAEKKFTAGVVTRADVLRLQVAAANAKQQEIAARAQERQVRAELLESLGMVADGDSLEFGEPIVLENTMATPIDTAAARQLAVNQRPEVLSMGYQARSAAHRRYGRWLSLLPEINAEAAYTHIDGQVLAPANQLFVGVKADWAFWEWGATFFESRSADAMHRAAVADLDRMQRQVGVEVASRQADTAAAASAIKVSQLALDSAEEAFRVTQQESRAGSATTTDLLDAEAALTRARLNVVRARYDSAIAQVALAHALGNP
jgi:outer membrane protein